MDPSKPLIDLKCPNTLYNLLKSLNKQLVIAHNSGLPTLEIEKKRNKLLEIWSNLEEQNSKFR